MSSRRKGRILAFQALYSWDLVYSQTGKAVIPEGLLDFPWLENEKKTAFDEETFAFSRLLVTGTVENIAAIDATISSHLKNWDITRLNRVDLAIMRMSAYALMYQDETAPSIVINEAIGISKEFGTDDS
jgi:N utilization substance protein B